MNCEITCGFRLDENTQAHNKLTKGILFHFQKVKQYNYNGVHDVLNDI